VRDPEVPALSPAGEGSPVAHSIVAGDPSLRLKNGYAQDDAAEAEQRYDKKAKLSHYRQAQWIDLEAIRRIMAANRESHIPNLKRGQL
jgi:hypothetical protein